MTNRRGFCAAVVLAALATGSARAEADRPVKSGPQVGERILNTFEPHIVTGPHAGRTHCLVCENGTRPVAMVFAREVSAPLVRLLERLDAAAAEDSRHELGCFAVFLSAKPQFPDRLRELSQQSRLRRVVLSVFSADGPDGFDVAAEAAVTVVLYREFEVLANHAFKSGELTDQAVEAILADLPRIMAHE